MNSRDPFNIRRTNSPFLAFRSLAEPLPPPVGWLEEHLRSITFTENTPEQALEVQKFTAAGGMSYASSENLNTPGRDVQRARDGAWQPRRPAQHGNGVTEKLTSAITGRRGSRDELPMYKDKPYNYTASQRTGFFHKRRRTLLLAIGLLATATYFLGGFWGPGTVLHGAGLDFGLLSTPLKDDQKWGKRQELVRDAFRVSWKGYEDNAWGFDEYKPVSKGGAQMVPDGFGWIIVDALDTMILMNLTQEVTHARQWIANTLNYDQDHDVNTFETTIRMLGGLLSAHYLTSAYPQLVPVSDTDLPGGEDLYLEKATDLADRLLGAYESRSGVPFASINLHSRTGIKSHDDGGASSTAEAGTVQLEMKYLAKLTGEKHYWDVAEKVMKVIDDNGVQDGLVPIFIHADEGTFRGNTIRFGSRGDSYYEYLIKQYLQTEKQEPIYLNMWEQTLVGVRKHLLAYSKHANLTVLGERPGGLDSPLSPKMDHLVCFMPGTIALATTRGLTLAEAKQYPGWGHEQDADMKLSRELMKTCWGMYKKTATGLAPEITHFELEVDELFVEGARQSVEYFSDDPEAEWREDYDIHAQDLHNLQRPETVESLFYMWRITGDVQYREWGWEMFESFMKYSEVEGGGAFTSIDNVNQIPPPHRDNMESFWLAETLKYFYLLFGPNDILPLDKVVFNTEAHPFPNFPLGKLFSTSWSRKPRFANGTIIPDGLAPLATEQAERPTQVVQVQKADDPPA